MNKTEGKRKGQEAAGEQRTSLWFLTYSLGQDRSENFLGPQALSRLWCHPPRIPSCNQPSLGWLAQSFSSTFGSSHDVVVMCEVMARSLGCTSQLSTVPPRMDLILHLSAGLATIFFAIQGLSWQMVRMRYFNCFCFGESFLSPQLTVNILAKSFSVILGNILTWYCDFRMHWGVWVTS